MPVKTATRWFAGIALGCASLAPAIPAATQAFVIRNVLIVDGTGGAPRRGSVRIEGDHITAIGAVRARRGDRVVDGHGQVLAPGFIDTHSHHDLGLDAHPHAEPLLAQGVTTIIAGQDGNASLSDDKPQPLSAVIAWRQAHPSAVNYAYYAGHNAIRSRAMGADADRPARADEIRKMQALLDQDLDAGALGLSTGLEYDPGHWAAPTEVLALAETAARRGGRYISHMRNEDDALDTAIAEVLAIGARTRMPVQISHLKLGAVQKWGQAPALLATLDRAAASGVKISADVYPYDRWYTAIISLYPKRDYDSVETTRYVLDRLVPPDGITIVTYRPDPTLAGRTLAAIAAARGQAPATTLIDLLRASGGAKSDLTVIGRSMKMDDVDALIAWPGSNISSDGSLYGQHPRGAGAFARVLRRYARETHQLSLATAIRKMSGAAADHVGLHDRGYIRVGYKADLVLFDPDKIADRATFARPTELAIGVDKVWVNGEPVWVAGKPTARLPGRFLARQDRRPW